MTDTKHYTFRVSWSGEDDEYVATVVEFPLLSWLDADQGKALQGLVGLVDEVVADMERLVSRSRSRWPTAATRASSTSASPNRCTGSWPARPRSRVSA